ncbi:tetratricopeptide repeat protein [Anaeromyxobacter sp. Fw109-5]|uniref:tetratricopeptide repeat protein n=1 Tax=Anaeromyxobacter sp. (strain Fw109-5) TaxID=404589 RepID=UPI0002DE389F|nr:tetratricopeptide repeat protein [Anaeromyxobacter sp. Fw109-5]
MKRTAPEPKTPGAEGHWLPLLAVTVLGLLSYSNSFGAAFVFDDVPSIVENVLIRDLRHYLPGGGTYAAAPNRYLGYLSFALNYAAGGLDPAGYHVVNLCVHLANALLVYALAILTFRTPGVRDSKLAGSSRIVAFAAAALFVAHPLQTNAVTYVVQRFASLATMFYLLAVVLYAWWRLRQETHPLAPAWSAASYGLVLASVVAAMRTKEIAFTLPLAIAGYELVFFGPLRKKTALALAPILATLAIIPLTMLGVTADVGAAVQRLEGATRNSELSRVEYLMTQLPVVASYLRLLIAPVGLTFDHDVPIARSLLEPRVLLGLVVVGGLLAVAAHLLWRSRPGAAGRLDPSGRVVGFGILWFFLALSVESSVIPIRDVMFEHRVYLPSAGLFIGAVTAALWLARRYSVPDRVTVATAAVLAIALGAATFARNLVWQDELALWGDAVAKAPNKTRPHTNYAHALRKLGRDEEALEHFRAVVRISPDHVDGMNNLAVHLERLGRTDEAAQWLELALRSKPDHAETYVNLGRLLLVEGRAPEAAALSQRAIELDPGYRDAYANLSGALNSLGRPDETLRLLESAPQVVQASPEARFNLGVAHVLLGNAAGASAQLAALQRGGSDRAGQLAAFMASRGMR